MGRLFRLSVAAAALGGYLQTCLRSGCWESKYVDKECGFTRQ